MNLVAQQVIVMINFSCNELIYQMNWCDKEIAVMKLHYKGNWHKVTLSMLLWNDDMTSSSCHFMSAFFGIK